MRESISPNTTVSHYRIVSKLGAGGMGEVYLAGRHTARPQGDYQVPAGRTTPDEQPKKQLMHEERAAAQLDQGGKE